LLQSIIVRELYLSRVNQAGQYDEVVIADAGGNAQRGMLAARAVSRAATPRATMRLDGHVHVWAPPKLADKYPYVGQLAGAAGAEPPIEGTMEQLLEQMDAADVQGALIVQPGCHQFDHSYVSHALKRYPDRLVGCLLADPSPSGSGAAAISKLAKEGYRAVRFNPYLWPDGEKMTNKEGREMYKLAGELGLPVGHMPFKGLLNHIEEIETLLKEYPQTTCIIDHYGFCNARMGEDFERLLTLAAFPQVYVKVSAHFRVSNEEFPYVDLRTQIRRLVNAFGAHRVMFGTDFPWVMDKCGYVNAWSVIEEGDKVTNSSLLTDEEKQFLYSGTLLSLLPGAWQ